VQLVRAARCLGRDRGPGPAAVNQWVGRFALRSAATLPLKQVDADPANGSDICDMRGQICF
jgi:hypothetical protein